MIIYADGAGDGRLAVIVDFGDDVVFKELKTVSVDTHNEAEWEALLFALEQVQEYGPVTIFMDSRLVVRQFNGVYKCRDQRMANYRHVAHRKIHARGIAVEVKWIPRDKNKAGWLLD